MTTPHDHPGFAPPTNPYGPPVNGLLIAQLMGAAFDRCQPCQAAVLTAVSDDPPSTAHLVELACIAYHQRIGGLPPALTEPAAPGLASPAFRDLARTGLDGSNAEMYTLCEAMTPPQRREAAETAADLLAGVIFLGAASEAQR